MAKASIKRPSTDAPPTRYEDDLYTWVTEQVALLRAGRVNEIDVLNVAEELSDVGKSEFRSLTSAIAVLAQHLLKWDHQPALRSRSWVLSIREQRRRIVQVLEDSPGLKARLGEAMTRGYASGRDYALAETELPDAALPETCPYMFDDMMSRRIEIGSSASGR